MNIFRAHKAEWIWLSQEQEIINQYVDFRQEFHINNIDEATESDCQLYISVDTEYAVWINGNFVECNQYDDFPNNKSYDVIDVKRFLREGSNVLCIQGYYQGEGSFQYIKGRPVLIYVLKTGREIIASGSNTTYCRQSKTYRSGCIEKISPQLAFTFEYEGNKYDGWLESQYRMGAGWVIAKAVTDMADVGLYKRPVKKLETCQRPEGKIIAQGYFIRNRRSCVNEADNNVSNGSVNSTGEHGATTAQLLQSDYLSSRLSIEIFGDGCGHDPVVPSEGLYIGRAADGNDGVYIVVDLQSEEAGYFELELEGEEGTVIEAAYGQHLDDLRVRACVGSRNFAFKYTCRDGYQKFTHYIKRISGRYIQLHISGIKKGITIYYAGIKPVRYPVEHKGCFNCNDRLLNRIYDVSVRTLELCMHEHYEDTPWREQGMYAMDSRNQAICGYYCFGEYDFPEKSFLLFTENLGADGYFEICTPAKYRITIPSFTMGWIMAVTDFVLYSGRLEAAEKFFHSVKKILDTGIGNMEDGLLKTPEGERYWNFYEWADGLDGSSDEAAGQNIKRFDAPLNLFFCLALGSGAKLAGWTGDCESKTLYEDCLKRLKINIHRKFWDESNQAYKTYIGGPIQDHFAELTQSLALCAGVVPEELIKALRGRLASKDRSLVGTTLSYAIFKYEALLQDIERYGRIVLDDIADNWGYMLYNRATSFWETIKGADDFEKAGSLCHGWSAIPVYFLHAYVLGIKPLEPGFRKFSANPAPVNVAERFSGKVPTPYGYISVRREIEEKSLRYEVVYPETILKL